MRRLVGRVEEAFGRTCCRETIRRAPHRLELSWKKARKLLGRADPQRREAFIAQVQELPAGARHDRHRPVYLGEAHIHQDADLGRGWSARGQRFWAASHSPRLADRLSFYGLHLHNEGEVRLWPYARANGGNTIDVPHRLRAEWPDQPLTLIWDGAPCHRAMAVREAATALRIDLVPLPGYSPDLMPVEALWRRPREDVTYHHCHRTAEDLSRRVAAFEARLNQDPCAVADRFGACSERVKDRLDPEEEKLRFSR